MRGKSEDEKNERKGRMKRMREIRKDGENERKGRMERIREKKGQRG